MKKSGNGDVETCASNLLKIRRGEVFFERLMGIGLYIDEPLDTAKQMAVAEIQQQVDAFESRAEIDETRIDDVIDDEGNIDAHIIVKKRGAR